MGQERFADIVERFASGYRDGAAAAEPWPDTVRRWQEEIERQQRRTQNLAEMMLNPTDPKVGCTPREGIFRTNKSRLYRYQSRRTHRIPLLFVPNLGISRPYIFDLLPGGSFVEHMTRGGFAFYLLDCGVFGPEANGLTLEDRLVKTRPNTVPPVLL